jgi:Ubiquitin-like modifier-activating enzyme ATG7 N-terminus
MQNEITEVLSNPSYLTPFHCLCYANLKKYTFDHHFSFPVLSSKWNVSKTEPADVPLTRAVQAYISNASLAQRGFFIITGKRDVQPLAYLLEYPPSEDVHPCFASVLTLVYYRILELVFDSAGTVSTKSLILSLPPFASPRLFCYTSSILPPSPFTDRDPLSCSPRFHSPETTPFSMGT